MRFWILNCLILAALGLAAGCSEQNKKAPAPQTAAPPPPKQIDLSAFLVGTAPRGGAFYVFGEAIKEVLNRELQSLGWKFDTAPTKGSLDNIRLISEGKIEAGLANSATTYFAAREGYPMQVLMTLAPNIAMFITREDSGIRGISDLKGKRVSIGPEGAGFYYFLLPILVAHDADFDGLQPVHCSQLEAVDLLLNRELDAAFLGGAVPTASIVKACGLMDIRLVEYEPAPVKVLRSEFVFFDEAVIPANTYPRQTEAFHGLDVGSMHLIVSKHLKEETAYQVTKAIYNQRRELIEKHPAAKSIQPANVVRNTGTEFHRGAVRFYKEIGIWKESPSRKDPER